MKTLFIERDGTKQKIYNSLVVNPSAMSIFKNELVGKILYELAREPAPPIDIARRLKIHEQKVYYYVRKLKDAGIIRIVGSENRFGLTAQIYDLAAPVVSAKLYDESYELVSTQGTIQDPQVVNFLSPFIKNGVMNSLIVIGEPYPHGPYGATARDGIYAIDLALYLGRHVTQFSPRCRMDVEMGVEDLKENLIVLGGPKINVITDRINSEMPVRFLKDQEWALFSSLSNRIYDYDFDALILRMQNPFNKKKELLLLAGKRSAALRSAIIAFTCYIDEVMKGNNHAPETIAKVVRGIDKDGDGIIDSVTFLE